MKNGVLLRFDRKAENRFKYSRPVNLLDAKLDDVRKEVQEYLGAHEAAGVHFDSECQEIVYDEHMVLLLHKEDGFWIITDIIFTKPIHVYFPVYVWKCIRHGLRSILAHVIATWGIIRKSASAFD